MGNTYDQQQKKGYRIINIEQNSPASHTNLQILVDYVLQPQPHNLSLIQQNVQLQVYSLVQQSIRSVNVTLGGNSLGLVLRHEPLNQCILKVINVLKGSPMERHQVRANEDYIIGMVEHPYNSLKGFMAVLKQVIDEEKSAVRLGVFSNKTGMRIVKIQVKELLQWKVKGKGILGCELAEGWANRIKPTRLPQQQKKVLQESAVEKSQNEKVELSNSPHPEIIDDIDEFQAKLSEHMPNLQTQKTFKGVLRCQQTQDASSFCKCVPINKFCQICSYRKEGINHFYCKKINKVFGIPDKMLFAT